MTSFIPVLLLTRSDAREAHWRTVLQRSARFRVFTGAEANRIEPPLLVLTDDYSLWHEFAASRGPSEVLGCGLVIVGELVGDEALPTHVLLPTDYADRELSLACELFGDNLLLRHQQHHGDQDRHRLRQMALSDSLTGLANRRAWNEEFPRRVEESRDTGRPLSLALIDLDNFKAINETAGYSGGDDVLRVAGNALGNSVRGGDFVARYGGDEFAVLISDVYPDDAPAVVERLRRALVEALASVDGPAVTASVGFASFNRDTMSSATNFFDVADETLRRAKGEGRDRSVSATPFPTNYSPPR